MKNRIGFLVLSIAVLSGCTTTQPWQYVRIESTLPNESCVYKIQEACSAAGAKCYVWFKKRAVKYNANTVVITLADQGISSRSAAFNGVGSSETNTNFTSLADYYECPKKN